MNADISQQEQPFETWAIVEIFGHKKLAGKATQVDLFGSAFMRLDIPDTETTPAQTRFYGADAIYSILPCDEDTAREFVEYTDVEPIYRFRVQEMAERLESLIALAPDGYDDGDAMSDAFGEYTPPPPEDLQDIPF